MKIRSISSVAVAAFSTFSYAVPTWPNAIDELEDVMFLNTGYKSRGFSSHITPCSFSEFGPGRQTAAEWLRVGFHDMATTNVFFEPHGGIDGSLAFELQNGENVGTGFASSLTIYSGHYNSRLSVADMIALGVHASVRGCGGPVVPMRGGRIDATAAGPIGVPQPQNGQGTFVNQFARMGFGIVDMIQMTACGHAIGGVHAANNPLIVAPGTAPDDYQLFDTTLEFDNKLAIQYVNGPISDPLTVGISVRNTRNSDFAVFTADKNVTIKTLQNVGTFNTVCSNILQKMIETVPPESVLSDVIAPYEVKPSGIQLTLLAGGSQIKFSGDIRVRTTSRTVSSVSITYKDRNGGTGGTITTTLAGTANGFDDSFAFYSFNKTFPATSSISSFTVSVAESGGLTTTFSNNGAGFPVQDSVIVLLPQSCSTNRNLQITAAVRTGTPAPTLTLTQKIPRAGGIPVPALSTSTATMTKGVTVGEYEIYSGTIAVSSPTGAKFGVSSGSFADDFKDVEWLGGTCTPFEGSSSSSSSMSSTASSSTSSTPSSTISSLSTLSSSASTSSSSTVSSSSTTKSSSTSTTSSATTLSTSTLSTSSTTLSTSTSKSSVSTTSSSSTSSSSLSSSTSKSSTSTTSSSSTSSIVSSSSTSKSSTSTTSTASTSSSTPSSSTKKPSTTSASTSTSSPSSSSSSTSRPLTSTTGTSSTSPSSFSSSTLSTSTLTSSTSKSSITTSSAPSSSTLGTSTAKPSTSTTITNPSTSKPSTTSTSSSSTTTAPSTPTHPSTIPPYTFQGCYTEPPNTRALSQKITFDYPAMTLDKCAASCAGYVFWGVEYGGECYCGNTLSPGSNPAPDSDCNFICPGDKSQYCGAGNRLSLYRLTNPPSPPPPPAKPTIPATSNGYNYTGCHTEPPNIRALPAALYASDELTVDLCVSYCKTAGYTMAGVEYARECWCANSLSAGSELVGDDECDMQCAGDAGEGCGGGNRVGVYVRN
ncbi:Heme-dependent peroxidase [Glarea lozoyensis ATCC 20868]|uniref:Heme-dependent peroxidase n=1 Tax=Glarea lozoyensis (strain ATCC 20868 / MF5171) TaxID=1116229 RepID=S3DES0_GLAL2|nr:Heme-dependent peroxidase [Glarea lozoyensis ATCC 20868]EPE35609.1 Heme-dependent peroxidase [Glarea lozoyensis ATCC 20868]